MSTRKAVVKADAERHYAIMQSIDEVREEINTLAKEARRFNMRGDKKQVEKLVEQIIALTSTTGVAL